MSNYILTIDQGTTSTRAILFDDKAQRIETHQLATSQYYPNSGWVEQDPEEIWTRTLECCKVVSDKKTIIALGITNQRETTILWDKNSGQAIYPAIVWQDRRTTEICQRLENQSLNKMMQEKTGLLIDPYFSATKIMWILENVKDARQKAERGEILFGTIDTFLLWRFTKGRVHATDATNASRTMLFNIVKQEWDQEILSQLNIPASILPRVLNSADNFGVVDKDFLGHEIPICSLIGDQQAALVGQACFQKGLGKITYGTGGFLMVNTGEQLLYSKNKLLSTVAYRLNNETCYAMEGSIFAAGTIVKWMRDKLKIISAASEADKLAESLTSNGGVYFIPAFTGLGAPYWNPNVRAAILGMTSNTDNAYIARAGLEAVCYQTKDLLQCMINDGFYALTHLRADGGMAISNWLLQFLASLLEINIERPKLIESTALGAYYFAALQCGIYNSLQEIENCWQQDRCFVPEKNFVVQECYLQWQVLISKML